MTTTMTDTNILNIDQNSDQTNVDEINFYGYAIDKSMYDWYCFMCPFPKEMEEFKQLFYECDYVIGSAINKYRKKVIDEREQLKSCKLISSKTLLHCQNNNDKDMLKYYLERLFVEIVDVDMVLRVINSNGWTWDKILEARSRDKYRRLFRIISCRCG